MRRFGPFVLAALVIATAARGADDGGAKPQAASYAQVQSVFAKHCVTCHNADDKDGELVLESYATLTKGGEHGAVVVPGRSSESLLLKLVRHEKKPFMPPPKKGDKDRKSVV